MKIQKLIESVVTRYPKTVLLIFLVLAGLSLTLLPGMTRNPTPYLLSESHPSRMNLEILRNNYTGSRDSVLILLESEKGIFNAKTLGRIQKLTTAFENIHIVTENDMNQLRAYAPDLKGEARNRVLSLADQKIDPSAWEELEYIRNLIDESGQWTPEFKNIFEQVRVRLNPIVEVTSLANTDNILGTEEGLDINPVYEQIPASEQALENIRLNVLNNKLMKDVLITEDGKYSSIILELAIKDDDSESQFMVYEKVKNILEKEIPGEENEYIAGFPVASATLSKSMKTDTAKLFPVVMFLVTVCLWISFRMFKGIIMPVAVVVFSLVMTLALMVLFKVPMNIVSTMLPVFIISIGVADGIHMFSEFRDHVMEGAGRVEAVRKTVRELSLPVIMTSLTTASAFLALSATRIVQIRHFGLFTAAGVIIAMILSLFFIPALLLVLPGFGAKPGKAKQSKADAYFTAALKSISLRVVKKAKPVLITACLVMALAVYGALQVKVDNNPVRYHHPKSELVVSTEKINTNAAGSANLNILVTALENENEPLKKPENLKNIAQLIDFLETRPYIGKVVSITKLIERINLVLHNGDTTYERIPEPVELVEKEKISGREMISQYLLLYENGGGDVLSDVVDSEYRQANLTVVLQSNSSRNLSALKKDITAFVSARFPENLKIEFSGSANISSASTMEIVSGQIISLSISLTLIFFMLIYTFRSFQQGLIAMIPLMATVLANFGIMGFLNIPLDFGTAVVSSIVIGIGVDYSIHYLSRLKESINQGLDFEQAVARTVSFSGKAIVFNAITVGTGFAAMLFSVLSPLFIMGWMITVSMFISSFCTIILVPAFLSVTRPGFISRKVAPKTELIPATAAS